MDAVAPTSVLSPHLVAMDALSNGPKSLDRPLRAIVADVSAEGDALEAERLNGARPLAESTAADTGPPFAASGPRARRQLGRRDMAPRSAGATSEDWR